MRQKSNPIGTWIIVATILAGLSLLVALAMRDQLAAVYHRSQFEKAHAAQIQLRQTYPRSGFVYIQSVQDIESDAFYNLNRLHELNAIVKLEFSFLKVASDSPRRRTLLDQLDAGNCPSNLTWHSIETSDSSPMTLTVWCDHDDANNWQSFVRSEDVNTTKRP